MYFFIKRKGVRFLSVLLLASMCMIIVFSKTASGESIVSNATVEVEVPQTKRIDSEKKKPASSKQSVSLPKTNEQTDFLLPLIGGLYLLLWLGLARWQFKKLAVKQTSA